MKNPLWMLRSLLALFCLSLMTNLGFSQSNQALQIALDHLSSEREALGLTPADIQNYYISDQYSSRHNGVTHIYLTQTHQEIPVRTALININILPTGKVLNMGNRFVPDLASKANASQPDIDPAAAVSKVMQEFEIDGVAPDRFQTQVAPNQYIFDPAGIALEPIKVKLVYEKTDDQQVRLAWLVQFYQLDAQHWWNARVDAQNGELLNHHDQVIHCKFNGPTGLCISAGHRHQAMKNKTSKPAEPQLGPVYTNTAANSYHVYPMPLFDPDHGDAELVVAPADFAASPFGWHDTDGEDGAEFTITRGNNVHAYHDIFAINSSSGDEPDGGATLDFNFPLDESSNFPYTQSDASVTNLFYWNNIVHDVWYQYGFDEPAGNFQMNNYGNGGQAGDFVMAEAMDGTDVNNANFGSGEDGSSARMQMYIWTNQGLPSFQTINVTQPESVVGAYAMAAAGFGNPLPSDPLVGKVVIVDDGAGLGSDACEEIVNGAEIAGNIALIDRGDCQFGLKVLRAENEGAIAVIMCNNVNDAPITMGAGADGGSVTIPSVMISMADCNKLRVTVPDLEVVLQDSELTIPLPGPSGRDGDFDNGIIVHEYGHGISNRLTGGPSTGGCLNSAEQAGEGWSDWFALVMSTTINNNGAEGRGMGTYAQGQPITGGGIREFRYSTNLSINPHTYGDVPSLIAPHGVGSAFCVMIWDLYWALIDEYGFNEDFYNGDGGNNMAMQLVIDGLKLQACNPDFVDSRNGILAADLANNGGANECLIWEVFARRGLGFSASSGGNEAFDLPPLCTPLNIRKTADHRIMAGNEITYTIEMTNIGESEIGNAIATDIFPDGTSYVEGSLSCGNGTVDGNTLTINAGSLAGAGSFVCTYKLKVDETPFSISSILDGAEDGIENWSIDSPVGSETWNIDNTNAFEGSASWFAENVASPSEQQLNFTVPVELSGNNPTFTFFHSFDTDPSGDGGVVELSKNGGTTWIDMGPFFILNGYNGKIANDNTNTLSNRQAFVGNSGGYIQSSLTLGAFNGDDVIIRFRFGSNAGVGGVGWNIDNVEVFEQFHYVTNEVCIIGEGQDEYCTEATTVVLDVMDTAAEDLSNNLDISITPNPTNGWFVLNMNSLEERPAKINILNVDGRIMHARDLPVNNGQFEFDLSELAAGVYFLEVRQENGSLVKKIVLQ